MPLLACGTADSEVGQPHLTLTFHAQSTDVPPKAPEVPFWVTEATIEIFDRPPWSDAHLRDRRIRGVGTATPVVPGVTGVYQD